jgi:hypothetical protein
MRSNEVFLMLQKYKKNQHASIAIKINYLLAAAKAKN